MPSSQLSSAGPEDPVWSGLESCLLAGIGGPRETSSVEMYVGFSAAVCGTNAISLTKLFLCNNKAILVSTCLL